jgi:hypothetical protein
MPYSAALESIIEELTLSWDGLATKKMFGGLCYLISGNMCFGVWQDLLIVRMAPELAAEKLHNEQVREFDITGKPMRGWVMVAKGSWNNRDDLANWLAIGRSFAQSLPKKSPKIKSLEEIYYRSKR